MHYLLIYDVSSDYLERRAEFRGAHLKLAWAAAERGELHLAGALADPYVLNGLVTKWRVRPWTTVVGERAATPVR
ncbi:hypothetical protein C9I56_25735 [Paraburkholderia caribensis]|uniref:hypothetical protein n=1 Tax=Paraburkholderia caribensis TaxID=75105 RepID=UPI000D16556E|nr:hypothetical protein [Paraburkholderia caribensis]PTB25918.1 hypothetical protein C9I56_25735 [Paraburkholderia caribensis]